MQNPELLPVLRTKILAEAAGHIDHSPWLDDLVRQAETSSPALVVLLHLMPQARRASEEGQKTLLARQERSQDEFTRLTRRVNEALAALRDGADALLVLSGEERRRQFGATLDAFMALGMDARDLIGNGSSAGSPTMSAIARAEPLVARMRDELEAWQSAGRINAVWRNQHVVNTIAGIAVFLLMLAPAWLPAALAIPALLLAWHFWILSEHRHAIRKLATALPWYVPGSGGERDSAPG